ncbi:MAG: Cu(I)-responsive transcriptional regulator [Aestuariivirga sp.]
METPMNIGQASSTSGVSAKMIRYYQSVGLLPDKKRSESGYRSFDDKDVHRLRFVRRSRDFGFSVAQISKLLGLWQGKKPSHDVKKLALAHVAELDQKIEHLQELRNTLKHLADCCHGDHRPECPIIESLSG